MAKRLFTDPNPRAKAALRTMLGLTDDDTGATHSSTGMSPGLAAVKAGVGNNAKGKVKGLSPKKLLELTDNFSSNVAVTQSVDRDGEGVNAATKEFVKLILDKDGHNSLQQILVEETAKAADATTRSLLRQALVESALAKGLSNIAPQQMSLVDELLGLGPDDEKILSTASELQEVLSSRIENSDLRKAIAENLSDGASIIPSTPELPAGLQNIVTDAETREFIIEQLPAVGMLGRRVGASLFRRAAYRAMKSTVLPEDAKSRLADVNNRLADVIEPATPTVE